MVAGFTQDIGHTFLISDIEFMYTGNTMIFLQLFIDVMNKHCTWFNKHCKIPH